MELEPTFGPEKRITNLEDRAVYKNFQDLIRGGRCKVQELRIARKESLITGEQYTLLVTLLAERYETTEGIDHLTNVFDRTFFKDELSRVKEELNKNEGEGKLQVQSVMIIFLDIKAFKLLNDTYGHLAGDKALVILADRLKKITKKNDIIFRVGGDEFIVVLPINNKNPRTLEAIFARIKNGMNTALSVDAGNIPVPFIVSMGFEVLNKGGDITDEELIEAAEQKMYLHKDRTKN